MMETHHKSRAEKMAATYGEVLIKAGVIKNQHPENNPVSVLHNQIIQGNVNWWQVCITQILIDKN